MQMSQRSLLPVEKVFSGVSYADLLTELRWRCARREASAGLHPLDEFRAFEDSRTFCLDCVQHQPRHSGRIDTHRRNGSRTDNQTAAFALPSWAARTCISVVN